MARRAAPVTIRECRHVARVQGTLMTDPAPRRHVLYGTLPSPDELRPHLHRLHVERVDAVNAGADTAYMTDLEEEIAEVDAMLVAGRVIQVARRRARRAGRQTG